VLRSIEPACAVILCVPADTGELGQLRTRYPRLVHVPFREDLGADAGARGGRIAAACRGSEAGAASGVTRGRSEQYAVLGRYMLEMKHSMNNAADFDFGEC